MSENRIFIGVKLKEQIVEWLQSALPPHKLLQEVVPENYHITLLFLGHVPQLDKLTERFEQLSFKPFFVSVTGLGGFYKKGKLKILYLRIDPDNDQLQHMHQELKSVFGNAAADQYPIFTPHITLNRNVKSLEIKQVEQFVNYTFPQPLEFEIDSLHLMDSGNFGFTKLYRTVSSIDLD
ncbi:RNA 2',3'-cyclic phosphodiesterase [Dyadobacter sp. CY356]|uniref:RNA 2',3'-cyclic phosphodiesterase n=1 Tax=Dyadobacter sp. CY356 TaxID=2906442 RepID=UPI001F217708|nr:RNA 2',3'-cyclic phosphodiesterase [Dyadobacter sp. CY356]MCF0057139.1 RNA 2',3'-cyclic phosphodiesterase [Dyadobacter sp. CY356]